MTNDVSVVDRNKVAMANVGNQLGGSGVLGVGQIYGGDSLVLNADGRRVDQIRGFDRKPPGRSISDTSVIGGVRFLHVLVNCSTFSDCIMGADLGLGVSKPGVGPGLRALLNVDYDTDNRVVVATGVEVGRGARALEDREAHASYL